MSKEEEFKVFIVEDDDWYRELINYNVSLNPDFKTKSFSSGKEFLQSLYENPNVVTLDYQLPDMEGTRILKEIKAFNPDIEVIIISQQEKIETAVELLKAGAYDYIVKDKDIRNRLLNAISHIRQNTDLKKTITTLKSEVRQKYDFENLIIGSSEGIKSIFALMEKAVTNNINVSVTGETGTGKELVAKAIHYNSIRKDHPFVPVNMAAIPKELIESELFGHEKGAFTGANTRRIGKFEEAHKGTIFLDEIGEMELPLQSKLLRVLQEREVIRIGSNERVKIDARVIVATNKNLLEEVKKGNFREDLYYRILGLNIHLPPLRDRRNDIIVLAQYFTDNFSRDNNMPEKQLSPEAKKKLINYPFPGNIRELKSVAELATVMSAGNIITELDIVLNPIDEFSEMVAEEMTLKDYTEKIIFQYLKKYDDNVMEVARRLDIGKSTIYRLLQEKQEKKSGTS